MAIVVGYGLHRSQITYDALNVATGEVATGRITPADRPTLRAFLQRRVGAEVQVAVEATTGWRFAVDELQRVGVSVQLAVEATTGWRFAVEELQRVGVSVQLAEPDEAAAARTPSAARRPIAATRATCAQLPPAQRVP